MLRAIGILSILTACGSVQSSSELVVQYDFDDGLVDQEGQLTVADASGNDRPAMIASENGGEELLEVVEGEDGQALRFPPRCEEEDPAQCPRVILEAAGTSAENPGPANFAIEVDLMVAPEDGGADQNVMQKGNFDDEAQWKIQIGASGQSECVFRVPGQEDSLLLRSSESIVDGAWHAVRCQRVGSELTNDTDGAVTSMSIPAEADFSNSRPLLMGGRDTGEQNDQFYGAVDNATFELL
jgi:Laminin G domain